MIEMQIIRTPAIQRRWLRPLLVCCCLLAGLGGLAPESAIAQSMRKNVHVRFEWKGDLYARLKTNQAAEFRQLELAAAEKVAGKGAETFSFLEWTVDKPASPPAAEWVVELATEPPESARGRWKVHVNHYVKVGMHDRIPIETSDARNLVPNKWLYNVGDRPAVTAAKLEADLKDKLDEQLSHLMQDRVTRRELHKVNISDRVVIDEENISIPVKLCELRVRQSAEFSVILTPRDPGENTTCDDAGNCGPRNRRRDDFDLREDGNCPNCNIIGEVIRWGIDTLPEPPTPLEPGWAEGFGQKLAQAGMHRVTMKNYEPLLSGCAAPADNNNLVLRPATRDSGQ